MPESRRENIGKDVCIDFDHLRCSFLVGEECLFDRTADDDRVSEGCRSKTSFLITIKRKSTQSLLECCVGGFRVTGGGTKFVRSNSFSSLLLTIIG